MSNHAKKPPVTHVVVGDYHYTKKGVSRYDISDPYHLAVRLSWPTFFALVMTIYLLVNFIFASLYAIAPGSVAQARPGHFVDLLFFSFETLTTVGFGEMYPQGNAGHFIASSEVFCGIWFMALLTGLVFVRFSRPKSKFIVAAFPVVARFNGTPALMLRLANGRATVLGQTEAKLSVLMLEQTEEGRNFRRAHSLKLERSHLPVFPLTWTIMHLIDATSPLFGMDEAAFVEGDTRLFLTLQSHDPVLGTTVHDSRSYAPNTIKFGMRYEDVISQAEDGSPIADLTRISAIEPLNGHVQ